METTGSPSGNFVCNVLNSSDILRQFYQNPPRGDLQTPQRGLKIGCKSTKNIGNNYICTQKNDILLANFLHLFIKREKFVNVISFNHWIGGFSSIPSGEFANPLWGDCNLQNNQRSSRIFLFALSTTDASSEARYMRVVLSESCPIPSLIVEIGIFFALAMLAHE